jgi:hypothetical protein
MSLTPEYGEEEILDLDEAALRRKSSAHSPGVDYVGEQEVQERMLEDRELVGIDPEDNELHAAGQVCERCEQVITASQDVRRLVDGHFVHEVCPRSRRA